MWFVRSSWQYRVTPSTSLRPSLSIVTSFISFSWIASSPFSWTHLTPACKTGHSDDV